MVFKRYKNAERSSVGTTKHRVKPGVLETPQYNSVLGSVDVYKAKRGRGKKGKRDSSSSGFSRKKKGNLIRLSVSDSSGLSSISAGRAPPSTCTKSRSKWSKPSSSARSSTDTERVKEPEIFRASHSEMKRRIREKIEQKVEYELNKPHVLQDHWGKYVGSDSDISHYSLSRSDYFRSGSSSDSSTAPPGGWEDNMEKWSEHGDEGHCKLFRYGTAQLRGIRRTQQDAFFVKEEFKVKKVAAPLLGVFDGHGTEKVSELCANDIPDLVAKHTKGTTFKAVKAGFTKAYSEFASAAREAKIEGDGEVASTTATLALITKQQIVVASLGNTRAVLCVKGKPVALSIDTAEVPRVTPGIMKHSLKGVEFLLLVSDGVADVLSDEELVQMIKIKLDRGTGMEALCKSLLTLAFALGSLDNMTIVLADFKKR